MCGIFCLDFCDILRDMALSWSAKRQLGYFSVIGGLILVFLISYIYPKVNKAPTCSDGRQNASEEGIDCGGSCAKLCAFQTSNILIRWARVFPVTSSVYNAVAYVENQNPSSAVRKISYEFKVYDEQGIFITARAGESFIGRAGRFAILEPAINVGNRVPAKTLFKFTSAPVWEKIDAKWATFPVSVRDKKMFNVETTPKLEATLDNASIYDLADIAVVAILYDKDGNAFAGSRTYLDQLSKNSSAPVYFTWPEAFNTGAFNIEVLPQINPFTTTL